MIQQQNAVPNKTTAGDTHYSMGNNSAVTSTDLPTHTVNENADLSVVHWSDIAEWLERVPSDGEDVVIPHGLTVVLDEDTPELGNLVVHGQVIFGETDVTLTADNIIVFGEMRAGSEDKPHIHKAEIILTGKSADPDVVLADWIRDGHMMGHEEHASHMSEPIDNKALIVAPGGTLELHGADVDSWVQLNSTANIGDTSITLSTSPTGWSIGDTIAIAPTDLDAFEVEERVITAIKGNTVSFDQPLEHLHYGEQQNLGDGKSLDMRAEVANLSRNISISGSEEGETRVVKTLSDNPNHTATIGYGGHTMYLADSTIKIEGVEFTGLGLSGELGRYPIHFHHTGDASESYIKDSSIHHVFQRGIVVHQADNALIQNNIVYDTVGHSFYLEDGVETGNRFVDNLALLPRSTPVEVSLGDLNQSSRRSSAFWITNASNVFEGNHAVGVPGGMGFWFSKPDHKFESAGLSPTDPRQHRPLLSFQDNTAHTIMFDQNFGSNLNYGNGWTGVALDLGGNKKVISGKADNHAPIEDFTAWKIGNIAIAALPRNSETVILDPLLAEARVMFDSDGFGPPVTISNPTLVIETENNAQWVNPKEIFPTTFPGRVITHVQRDIDLVGLDLINEDALFSVTKDRQENFVTFSKNGDGEGFVDILDLAQQYIADSSGETIYGFGGNDTLRGMNSNDVLIGGDGDDWIGGHGGDDIMVGGVGNDHLQQTSGGQAEDSNYDIFFGGVGNDVIELNNIKSTSSNTVIFRRGDDQDVINDFGSKSDKVVLVGYGASDLDTDGDGDFDQVDIDARTTVKRIKRTSEKSFDLGQGDMLTFRGRNDLNSVSPENFLFQPNVSATTGQVAQALKLDETAPSSSPDPNLEEEDSSQDTPMDDIPTDDTPMYDAPSGDTPTDDVPTSDPPVDNVPTSDAPADDSPDSPQGGTPNFSTDLEPVSLTATDVSLDTSTDTQAWGNGVTIYGLDSSGQSAAIGVSRGSLAVKGGRYSSQIDYDPTSGTSEQFVIDFNGDVKDVSIELGKMSLAEWQGLSETGVWEAYNANGSAVASGILDPTAATTQLSKSSFAFALDSGTPLSKLIISASAYGNGEGTDRINNNSDFTIDGLTYTPLEEPSTEGPPVEDPPVDGPPVEEPPVDGPPVEEPPVEEPPVDGPPVEEPPVEEPPVEEPPVEEPPVEEPPVEEPPVEEPPVEEPPVEGPPVEEPPVDGPPVEGPPVEEPPVDGPPVEEPPVEEPPVEEPPADGAPVTLKASGDFLDGSTQPQEWGDNVTVRAFDLDGNPAEVVYSNDFRDKGLGVSGGRWTQLDFYAEGGDRSERLELDFDGLVSDITLTIGMLGLNEGGRKQGYDETGKWTAFDTQGNQVAEGLIGPELSLLGADVKVPGSYGIYPIAVNAPVPVAKISIEATGFGHGEGGPRQRSYGENNSDFSLVEISYERLNISSPRDQSSVVLSSNISVDDGVTTALSSQDADLLNTAEITVNNTFANEVLELTNQVRQENGLLPLSMNQDLVEAAQDHAQDMAQDDFFSHTGIDGSSILNRVVEAGYVPKAVGENIAAGQTTPEAVVEEWKNSPGHLANLLNENFSEIGIGYEFLANDTGDVNYNHYWAQAFGQSQQSEKSHAGNEVTIEQSVTLPDHSPTPALNLSKLQSYGGKKQDRASKVRLSADNTALQIKGNGWKKLSINHPITPETVISFEFRSHSEGEIQSIGFDNNNSIGRKDKQTSFQLAGSQDWGRDNFKTYVAGSGWQSFQIPVGKYFTGYKNYLTFGNDHDSRMMSEKTAVSEFRNLYLFESSMGISEKPGTDPIDPKLPELSSQMSDSFHSTLSQNLT